MSKGKIKIHIRNNHWKKGSLPCDLEGEKNSSVPKELFENFLNKHPKIKHKISYKLHKKSRLVKSKRTKK